MLKRGDLIEDFEGDMAVVREITEDGRVGVEWDCRPGVTTWPDASFLEQGYTNVSQRVRELDAEHGRYAWDPSRSLAYECPDCGSEVDIRTAAAL